MQLYGALIRKIIGQNNEHSIEDIHHKYPFLISYLINLFKQPTSQHTFQILELLSQTYTIEDNLESIKVIKDLTLLKLSNSNYYLRNLAAKTYAKLTSFKKAPTELEEIIEKTLKISSDVNKTHGYVLLISHLIQEHNLDKNQLKGLIKRLEYLPHFVLCQLKFEKKRIPNEVEGYLNQLDYKDINEDLFNEIFLINIESNDKVIKMISENLILKVLLTTNFNLPKCDIIVKNQQVFINNQGINSLVMLSIFANLIPFQLIPFDYNREDEDDRLQMSECLLLILKRNFNNLTPEHKYNLILFNYKLLIDEVEDVRESSAKFVAELQGVLKGVECGIEHPYCAIITLFKECLIRVCNNLEYCKFVVECLLRLESVTQGGKNPFKHLFVQNNLEDVYIMDIWFERLFEMVKVLSQVDFEELKLFVMERWEMFNDCKQGIVMSKVRLDFIDKVKGLMK